MYSLVEHVEKSRGKPAFTMAELLAAVVGLAILSSILLPKLMSSNTRAKEIELKSDLITLRTAIQAFRADTGHYPFRLQDLAETDVTRVRVASGRKVDKETWQGPYLESIPHDPVSGGWFRYVPKTGKVSSATSGPALDGTQYSSW